MRKILLSVLLGMAVITLCNSVAVAEDKDTLISVSADYWMPTFDAKIKSTELAVIGSEIDFNDDLGLEDSETIPSFKASLDLPFLPELLVSYFAVDSDATKTLTRNLVYKGVTYTASESVASSYDITQYEALLVFPLINEDAGKLGILVGAKYFEVDTELKGSVTGTKTESVDGPVPVVGLNAGLQLPAKFRIEALARGLVLEVEDIDASMFDIELNLNYDFNRFLRATAGYRYFAIDAEDTSTGDSVDISFTGPYIGLTGSF